MIMSVICCKRALVILPSTNGRVKGSPIVTVIRQNGKGNRKYPRMFSVPVMATGRMGAWVLTARYATPGCPLCIPSPRLRVPSGNSAMGLSLANSPMFQRSASRSGPSRFRGCTLTAVKKAEDIGFEKRLRLPRKWSCLGRLAVNMGGSALLRWLETTISGPFGGTASLPCTSHRAKAVKQIRVRVVPAVYIRPMGTNQPAPGLSP